MSILTKKRPPEDLAKETPPEDLAKDTLPEKSIQERARKKEIDPQYLELHQVDPSVGAERSTGLAVRFPSTNREEWFLYKSCANWPQGKAAYQWPCGTASSISIRFTPIDAVLASDTEAATHVANIKTQLANEHITYDYVVITFTKTTVNN